MLRSFFAVELQTVTGPVMAEATFETRRAAEKFAKLLSGSFSCRVLQGGAGGLEVSSFPRS